MSNDKHRLMQRMDAVCESERRFSRTVLVLLEFGSTGQPNYYGIAIVLCLWLWHCIQHYVLRGATALLVAAVKR